MFLNFVKIYLKLVILDLVLLFFTKKNMHGYHIITDSQALCGFPVSFFDAVMQTTIERSGRKISEGKILTIGVSGLSEEEIRSMNKRYLKKDAPTDILSFPEEEGDVRKRLHGVEKEMHLGDIFLCCPIISAYAKKDGVSIRREMVYIFSHGVLHLLGYDHEPEQFSIQDEVCGILGEEFGEVCKVVKS